MGRKVAALALPIYREGSDDPDSTGGHENIPDCNQIDSLNGILDSEGEDRTECEQKY